VIIEPIKLRIFVFLSRGNVRPEILRLRPVCTLLALSVLVNIVCIVLPLAPCALTEAMYDVINTALKHLFRPRSDIRCERRDLHFTSRMHRSDQYFSTCSEYWNAVYVEVVWQKHEYLHAKQTSTKAKA